MITPETNALLSYNRAVEAAAWAKIEAEKAGMPMHFRRFDADIAFKVIDLKKKTLMPSTQLSVEDAQRAFSMIEANVLHDFAPKPDQFSIVRSFLDGLALLGEADQVVNSDEEGYILEGAGQSGFEMVDDNGNLFVVHTNDLIKYVLAQRAGATNDTARMDWLTMKAVNVREPLRYGSKDMFWASPVDDDGEQLPSDIRAQIDQARVAK